jgi:hypothetical protein
VTLSAGNGAVTLTWGGFQDATSYNIYWATTPGITLSNSSRIRSATSPYTLSGLANGTTYYLMVTAENSAGESLASSVASATPSAPQARLFPSYVGNWTGTWRNNTFASTGQATLAVALNPGGTQMTWSIAVQGNVFGVGSPAPETFVGAVGPATITLTGNSATFGQVTLTIDANGNVTGSGMNLTTPNVTRFDFTGTWSASNFDLTYTATLTTGGTATGVFNLTKP